MISQLATFTSQETEKKTSGTLGSAVVAQWNYFVT